MAAPIVSGVNPATGATGTSVTVSGSGFTGTTAVNFGTVAASGFTVNSDTEIAAQAPAPNTSGAVDVTVTNPDGTSATGSSDLFTYDPLPTVTGVSPASGIAGTSVTVTGTGLTGATSVSFGTSAGTALSVSSDTQLSVSAPAQSASGAVDVLVTTPAGQSVAGAADQFTYLPAPLVTGVSPSTGQSGTVVAVTGSGFTGATTVNFGSVAGTALNVVSDTEISITAPVPTASGVVDITVTTPNGTSAAGTADQFTYDPVPTVTAVNPSSGGSGTAVTVTGAGFTGATSVTFGGVAGTSLNVSSDTELTVTTPAPNASGPVDVIVTTPTGSSAASAAAKFTFAGVPVVTSINPSAGAPGTVVTVNGSGFTGATAVNFGGAAGTVLSIASDTQLTITAPAPIASGSAVDVTVIGPAGTSTTGAGDQFTYNHCCVKTFNVPTARSGCTTVPDTGGNNKLGESFKMEIDFDSAAAGCSCACGEYRQFVRGTFTSNGTTVVHLLPNPAGGAPLKLLPRPAAGAPSDNFLEDGVPSPPLASNFFYGRRSETRGFTSDQYLPDRPTGCQYRGFDYPAIANVAGTKVSVDLDFRGLAIDTCNANATVQQNDWTVTCSGTL